MIVTDCRSIESVRASKSPCRPPSTGRLSERVSKIHALDAESSSPIGFLDWLNRQVSVTTERIDRAQRSERKLRERRVLQARYCWDADRRIEAEGLGSKLETDPSEVVAALKQTPQGCEWLIKRWALLIHTAETESEWTLEQASLASRMLGTPEEFQNEANPLEMVEIDGRPIRTKADRLILARRQVQELLEERDRIAPVDDDARRQAQDSESVVAVQSDDFRHLARHERTLCLHLRWLIRQIELISEAPPTRTPEFTSLDVEKQPSDTREPAEEDVRQPFPAEEDVSPSAESIPTPGRREVQLRKAEARREARVRKLERRRS